MLVEVDLLMFLLSVVADRAGTRPPHLVVVVREACWLLPTLTLLPGRKLSLLVAVHQR